MTEYIILVGLIAILLTGAVLRFSDQIKATFIGRNGNGGAAGDLNNVGDQINSGGLTDQGGGVRPRPSPQPPQNPGG
jgi:hypothetical protein